MLLVVLVDEVFGVESHGWFEVGVDRVGYWEQLCLGVLVEWDAEQVGYFALVG